MSADSLEPAVPARGAWLVAAAAAADLPALVAMCREHAEYEANPDAATATEDGLRRALFAPSPRLHAWIAHSGSRAVGFATASLEFSTWSAGEYVHMDCLFVREGFRGRGIGPALMARVLEFARHEACREVQWQTPAWNHDAIHFYGRQGAAGRAKLRFTLAVASGDRT